MESTLQLSSSREVRGGGALQSSADRIRSHDLTVLNHHADDSAMDVSYSVIHTVTNFNFTPILENQHQ